MAIYHDRNTAVNLTEVIQVSDVLTPERAIAELKGWR